MDGILEINEVPGSPVVGQIYLVPCLESQELGWMPVIPFIHQDPELKNPRYHVHYDHRFIDDEMSNRLLSAKGETALPVFNTRKNMQFVLREMMCIKAENEIDPHLLAEDGEDFVAGMDDNCREKTFKGKVCPHKGYPLEGILPDSNGIVTCPLHGARWNSDGSYAGTCFFASNVCRK